MKLSELENLFTEKLSLEDFKKGIEKETFLYKNQSREKGRSVSIYIEEDIENFRIEKTNIIFLCDAYLNGIIDSSQLNYIAEAISFCDNVVFADEKTSLSIELLSDPEIDRLINDNYILNIKSQLQDD